MTDTLGGAGLTLPGSPGWGRPTEQSVTSSAFKMSSDDVALLDRRLKLIITDIGGLQKAIDNLTPSIKKMADQFDRLPGAKGGKGGTGGTSLTVASVSGSGGTGATTTTPANMTAGRTLAYGAVGEIGSLWAGRINTAVSGFTGGGGMSLDLLARQTNQVFGRTGPGALMLTTGQFTGVSNFSQADLAQSLQTLRANPQLFSPGQLGRAGGGGVAPTGSLGFMQMMQRLNPSLGATGSAQAAAQLAAPSTQANLMMYGGRNAGLVNYFTGKINNPATTFRTLLSAGSIQTVTTPAAARRAAQSPNQWATISYNLQQQGVPQSVIDNLRQYAAAGMNLNAATPKGAVATSALARSTAGTATGQTAYETTSGTQNLINTFATHLQGINKDLVIAVPGLASMGLGFGVVTKNLFMLSAAVMEARAALLATGGLKGGGIGIGGGGGVTTAVEGEAPALTGLAGSTRFGASALSGMQSIGAATLKTALGRAGPALGLGVGGALLGSLVSGGRPNTAQGGWRGTAGSAVGAMGKDAALGLMIGGPWGAAIGAGVGGVASLLDRYTGVEKVPVLGDIMKFLGDPPTAGMSPALSQGVSAMMRDNPKLRINSGRRSAAQQALLYNLKGGKNVARPGHSRHQTGHAVDIGPKSQTSWVTANARKYGLYNPSSKEPWHLEAMGDPSGASIVSAADAWIGTPYQSGGQGTQPGQGVDCSRFVQEVYAKVGISLPRTTYQQVKCGSAVNGLKNAQPGDLIFYTYSVAEGGEGQANDHVAIYIGNGKQIAAPDTGSRVQIQNVDTSHISAIRRITNGASAVGAASTAAASAGVAASAVSAASGGGYTGPGAPGLATDFGSMISGSWLNGTGLGGGVGSSSGGTAAVTGTAAGTGNTGTTAGPTTGGPVSGSGGSGTQKQVVQAVMSLPSMTKDLALAMLTGSALESNQNPAAKGAGSYGAWQIQMLAGRSVSPAQAMNPTFAAKFMYPAYKGALGSVSPALWSSNAAQAAEQVAYHAERPAADYYTSQGPSRVSAAFALASSEVGDPVGPTMSTGGKISGQKGLISQSSGRSSGIVIHMPIYQVGTATTTDAKNLVKMVLAELSKQGVAATLGNT